MTESNDRNVLVRCIEVFEGNAVVELTIVVIQTLVMFTDVCLRTCHEKRGQGYTTKTGTNLSHNGSSEHSKSVLLSLEFCRCAHAHKRHSISVDTMALLLLLNKFHIICFLSGK